MKPYRDEAIISAVRLAVPPLVETDAIVAARRTSLATICEIVALTGYPEFYADDLEARAFAAGQVWRRVW
jgi:hypothetical protein